MAAARLCYAAARTALTAARPFAACGFTWRVPRVRRQAEERRAKRRGATEHTSCIVLFDEVDRAADGACIDSSLHLPCPTGAKPLR